MNLKLTISLLACIVTLLSYGQKHLLVYHGSGNVTQVFDGSTKESILNPKIRLEENEILTVTIVNPNPFFYSYKLKTVDIEVKSEEKEITDLLATFNKVLSPPNGFISITYENVIKQLTVDINQAKSYIINSDQPESLEQAMKYDANVGFRNAVTQINGISNMKYRFNNEKLLSDLNALIDPAMADTFKKEAFELLNNSLVAKINEIKSKVNLKTVQTVWKQEFKVTDKPTQVSIEIEKIEENNKLSRDGNSTPFVLNIASIEPYFKRAILELVPVANLIYAGDYNEFYLEDNIVRSRELNKTKVTTGVILNANVARFGDSKEMAVGIGLGYKFNSEANDFENFYLSAMFSYKNFLRIGIGAGFSQVPSDDLKGGVQIGSTLPSDISNLDDLIQYQEKPSVFLTISFTGLNLTNKK